jgi:hypothetical protein
MLPFDKDLGLDTHIVLGHSENIRAANANGFVSGNPFSVDMLQQ